MKAAIRKPQLLAMVPMSESQITKLEKAGEFPQRFALTNRTVAWNKDEVEAWLDKQQAENTGRTPDYSLTSASANAGQYAKLTTTSCSAPRTWRRSPRTRHSSRSRRRCSNHRPRDREDVNHAAPVLCRRSNARFPVVVSDTSKYEFALHIYRSGYRVVVFDYLSGNQTLLSRHAETHMTKLVALIASEDRGKNLLFVSASESYSWSPQD